MSKLEMRQALIMEGRDVVTISSGAVPVVRLLAPAGKIKTGEGVEYSLPEVVNFLRSGCAMVQLSTVSLEKLVELQAAAVRYQEALNSLSIVGESFSCVARESGEGREEWGKCGRCIDVTRQISK